MPFLSFGIAWFGYTLLVWGVATVRSCNVTFTQLAWPGKFVGCNPDPGATPATQPNAATVHNNQTAAEKSGAATGGVGSVKSQPPGEVGLPPGYLGRG